MPKCPADAQCRTGTVNLQPLSQTLRVPFIHSLWKKKNIQSVSQSVSSCFKLGSTRLPYLPWVMRPRFTKLITLMLDSRRSSLRVGAYSLASLKIALGSMSMVCCCMLVEREKKVTNACRIPNESKLTDMIDGGSIILFHSGPDFMFATE